MEDPKKFTIIADLSEPNKYFGFNEWCEHLRKNCMNQRKEACVPTKIDLGYINLPQPSNREYERSLEALIIKQFEKYESMCSTGLISTKDYMCFNYAHFIYLSLFLLVFGIFLDVLWILIHRIYQRKKIIGKMYHELVYKEAKKHRQIVELMKEISKTETKQPNSVL